MVIGIPKEIKAGEYRVSLTPSGTKQLTAEGHTVIVQKDAGIGAGFQNQDYLEQGAIICDTASEVFGKSEMIVKVKEPLAEEVRMLKQDQILFAYLHLASSKELTEGLIHSKSICLAYETLTEKDNSLPLLLPMSEIAGRLSIQQGAKYLEKYMGGKGVLLSGGTGTEKGKVVIVGGGVVGYNAAKIASGMGAQVVLFDINTQRLLHLEEILPKNVTCLKISESLLLKHLKDCDLLIGAVLIPGSKAPKVIKKEHLSAMEKGSVIVDVAIDQGGCTETSRPTTHQQPVYEMEGIIHYCVANMPGAVPKTSTLALTNATLPFISTIAKHPKLDYLMNHPTLKTSINIAGGKVFLNKILE